MNHAPKWASNLQPSRLNSNAMPLYHDGTFTNLLECINHTKIVMTKTNMYLIYLIRYKGYRINKYTNYHLSLSFRIYKCLLL